MKQTFKDDDGDTIEISPSETRAGAIFLTCSLSGAFLTPTMRRELAAALLDGLDSEVVKPTNQRATFIAEFESSVLNDCPYGEATWNALVAAGVVQ